MSNKKNISLVTWIGGGNYGTSLQSYSLHYYLERCGYNVSIVTAWPTSKGLKSYLKYLASTLGLLWFVNFWRQRNASIKTRKLNHFIRRSYNQPTLITENQRKKYLEKIDVFITGSDQIWNTYYRFDSTMFLGFVKGEKKVAYASSIGASSVKDDFKKEVCNLLMEFQHIGVREKEAVSVLSELTGRSDIKQVLDPTFLLSSGDWNELTKSIKLDIDCPPKYIFCYLIGNNECYQKQILEVKKTVGIDDIIIIPSEENPNFCIEGAAVYNSASPLEFVKLIESSTLVCTDSFHATALSINLCKDFVEFVRFNNADKASQNSRIFDILTHYSLTGKLFKPDSLQWLEPIRYDEVTAKLETDRKLSNSFLFDAIES